MFSRVREFIDSLVRSARSSRKERNRLLILAVSCLFILDYLAFFYHIDKNIFDIVPLLPELDLRNTAEIYLPSNYNMSVIAEKRMVPEFDNDERMAEFLFKNVVRGSIYENTSVMVPCGLFIRKIWIYTDDKNERTCVFDVSPDLLKSNAASIKGSEALFIDALTKTITVNIPSIKKVIMVNNGIPDRIVWDI